MTDFRVTVVVDGDTFDVSPGWQWNGQTGTRVRPAGYDAPEMNTPAGRGAKIKLNNMLSGQVVRLADAYKIDRGRLVCEVYLNGKNLREYFPRYQ